MGLLFVDTNIWLDFYRSKTEAGLTLLNHLDSIKDKLIVTFQVEMEFKKNRQRVLLEAFNELKVPSPTPIPRIFSNAKAATTIDISQKRVKTKVEHLRKRIIAILEKPTTSDEVYKACQRCFHKEDRLSLTREHPLKNAIRRRAMRRFLHGCPPRKSNDTSFGDGINWEWIIECAQSDSARNEIHIVSRDADYGASFEKTPYVNDHLLHEFKDRVSQKRKLVLHTKLTEALKQFSINVSQAEKAEEENIEKQTASLTSKMNPYLSRFDFSAQHDAIHEYIWDLVARDYFGKSLGSQIPSQKVEQKPDSSGKE